LIKSQIFILDWPKLGHIRVEEAQIGRKCGSQEPEMVIHSFYIQIRPIILISSLN